jgi:hypothetical protein
MTIVFFQTKDRRKLNTTAEAYILYHTFEAVDQNGETHVIKKEDIKKILFCDNI